MHSRNFTVCKGPLIESVKYARAHTQKLYGMQGATYINYTVFKGHVSQESSQWFATFALKANSYYGDLLLTTSSAEAKSVQ